MTDTPPQPGFARHPRRSPLTDPWEPLWSKREGEAFHLAATIAEAHCNARGFAHGGLISALADNAMGLACVLADGKAAGAVTANLSVDFLGSAQIGQWLEVVATPVRIGGTLAFAEARISADGEPVARASAVFKMQRAKGD